MFAVLLLFVTHMSGCRGENDFKPDEKLLDDLVKDVMECYPNTAAFAISAVKDGKVVLNKAYGKASREKDIDVTPNTRFTIGSISKGFTSYMAGKQVAEGLYHWQDKIVDVFAKKDINMTLNGEFRNKHCTIEDAMIHKTGVKSYSYLLGDGKGITRAQWVTDYLPHFQEQVEMRSKFYYNNWFYTMMGYLIELFGGKTFEQQVKETMFDPLGMTQTMFVTDPEYDELSEADFSQPYKENTAEDKLYPVPKHAMKYIGTHNPAGGIVSTVGDMAKYMIGIIDAVNGKEGAVLRTDVLRQITQPKVWMDGFDSLIKRPNFPVTFKDSVYGYGYQLGSYRGYEYLHHGGATYGHFSYITTIPSLNLGVFSVISGDDYAYKDIKNMQMLMQMYLFDVMMGVSDPWVDKDGVCSFPDKWIPKKYPVPQQTEVDYVEYRSLDHEIARNEEQEFKPELYVGNFSNPVFPVMRLLLQDSNLKFEMGESNGTVARTPDGRLEVTLTRPTDPHNLPDVDKSKAYLHFTSASDKFEELDFVFLFERYKFHRKYEVNDTQKNSSTLFLTIGTVLLSFFRVDLFIS